MPEDAGTKPMTRASSVHDWAESLCEALERKLSSIHESRFYSLALTNHVKVALLSFEEGKTHGHPVTWLVFGVTGAQAFAIGRMGEYDPASDDKTEAHFTPYELLRALSEFGFEYIHSQVAIVVAPAEAKPEQENWLRIWSEDPTYMRRLYLSESAAETEDSLAERLLKEVLVPWYAMVTMQAQDNNDGCVILAADEVD